MPIPSRLLSVSGNFLCKPLIVLQNKHNNYYKWLRVEDKTWWMSFNLQVPHLPTETCAITWFEVLKVDSLEQERHMSHCTDYSLEFVALSTSLSLFSRKARQPFCFSGFNSSQFCYSSVLERNKEAYFIKQYHYCPWILKTIYCHVIEWV